MYLIATFPSRHYDIEQYPAVKEYLLSFGIERLEQTGKEHNVNGEKIKARKKTSNKWFETQDSISYWDNKVEVCQNVVYDSVCVNITLDFKTEEEWSDILNFAFEVYDKVQRSED